MGAQHFDEDQLGNAQQHRLAAGRSIARLGQRVVEQPAEPIVGDDRRQPHPHQRRQRGQHRVERQRVAAQESADHTDAFGSAAALLDDER